MNPHIFRAYDIRGVFEKDFTRKDAYLIGQGFGTYLQKRSGPRIVVGHDNRFSSDELNASLVAGLMSTGCDVTDIGLSLTPIVHFAVLHFGFDGGIIVTASHNPKEYNGFRFDTRNAMPVFNKSLQELRVLTEKQEFAQGEGRIQYQDVFEDYYRSIVTRLSLKRRLKVVVDCGNGTASKFGPYILERIGCEVVQLFCNLDGDYPYHTPNPEERVNMRFLQEKVKETGADLGVAFDTDADRFGIVGENGTVYENDKVLIVLAREILKKMPGMKVIYDVKSSVVLEDEIKKAGGMPIMIRTGHPYFKIQMAQDPTIVLGGELSSHTFIKDNYFGFDDGIYAGARLLEILSRVEHPFSEFFKDIEHTAHTEELKLYCPDDKKFEIVEKLKESLRVNWKIIDIDGVRIVFSDRAWALIRASNTMPALSVRFEAENVDRLNEIIDIVESRLRQYPVVDLGCMGNLECRISTFHETGGAA